MRRPIPLFVCFLFPLFLLLGGAVFSGVYGFRKIPELLDETARGMTPPGFAVELDSPGKYTVWLHERGQIGTEFHRGTDQLPPGGKIYVYDEASSQEIEFKRWMNATKHLGHEKAVSLGSFSSQREGQRVEIKGSGLAKPVLISVTPENTAKVLRIAFVILGIIVVALVVSITAFLYLLRRRNLVIESNTES